MPNNNNRHKPLTNLQRTTTQNDSNKIFQLHFGCQLWQFPPCLIAVGIEVQSSALHGLG